MIHNARDLSPGQKSVLEALLGRRIAEEEAVSVRIAGPANPPEWLQRSWDTAQRAGVNTLSSEEIDSEIAAARNTRSGRD